jgi:transposase, IS5 family
MEGQLSFGDVEYQAKGKLTRRDKFLADMDRVVPWARLIAWIQPHYPMGKRGRPPVGVERMLRIYFLQQWYSLSDEGLEDSLYDSQAMRRFLKLNSLDHCVPDATTLLKFRRLLEQHDLAPKILTEVNAMLMDKKLLMKQGTMMDATIINAASSTKNRAKQRDPDMHQTKKGQQCYLGMKTHIGSDAESGLVHSATCTAANQSDISQAHLLLHGEEDTCFADAGYQGIEKRTEIIDEHPDVQRHVATRRSKIAAMAEGPCKRIAKKIEKLKAQVRARVEHTIHVVKNLFGHRKCRYKGLAKNAHQIKALLTLANLYLVRGKLVPSA